MRRPAKSVMRDKDSSAQRMRLADTLLTPVSPSSAPTATKTVAFAGVQESEEIDVVVVDARIIELSGRILSMRKWKRDLERSVVWRRVEGWAVRGKMGLLAKERGETVRDGCDSGDGGRDGASAESDIGGAGRVQSIGGGWGVGGRTWERGSGRVPTQGEWEGLFAERGA